MPDERYPEYPDGRVKLSVVLDEHDLESGVKQLRPILQDILTSMDAPWPWNHPGWEGVAEDKFGRLTFSQHG
jgi:hypothetical protein